jgi:D-alanyl-D-alanine carboxypeptidase
MWKSDYLYLPRLVYLGDRRPIYRRLHFPAIATGGSAVSRRQRPIALLCTLLITFFIASAAPAGTFAQSTGQKPDAPEIGAVSAIVVEYPSGRILYQKAAHDRMPPASLTKILTAILALEYGKLDDVITITPEDLAGESTMGLVSGEQQTLHNLLYGMLLPSGNDAAMAIARYLGTHLGAAKPVDTDPVARFADMMNQRVSQLGLADTHFINPHGLDTPGHYSSAYDIASLAWYALHIPTFNEIVRTGQYDAPGHALLNTNEMLSRYPGADGIKTGWTDGCGLCLVTSATRDGHRLISVVLNAPRWYSDSTAILDYGFAVLASAPSDPGAEVLSISRRDTVTWLLANPESAPPVEAAPAAASLAQGGGAPQGALQDHAGAPVAGPPILSAASQGGPQVAAVVASGKAELNVPLATIIFGLLMALCFVLLARLWRVQIAASFLKVSALNLISRRAGPRSDDFDGGTTGPRPRAVRARTWGGVVTPAKPTEPRILPSTARKRREPNLLVALEDMGAVHVARAVELSAEGKQGSGMSEFVMALKAGTHLDVADLAEQYRLSSQAFLALARAQVAVGKKADARRTLLHGVLVMPDERVLRLALYQLQPES